MLNKLSRFGDFETLIMAKNTFTRSHNPFRMASFRQEKFQKFAPMSNLIWPRQAKFNRTRIQDKRMNQAAQIQRHIRVKMTSALVLLKIDNFETTYGNISSWIKKDNLNKIPNGASKCIFYLKVLSISIIICHNFVMQMFIWTILKGKIALSVMERGRQKLFENSLAPN